MHYIFTGDETESPSRDVVEGNVPTFEGCSRLLRRGDGDMEGGPQRRAMHSSNDKVSIIDSPQVLSNVMEGRAESVCTVPDFIHSARDEIYRMVLSKPERLLHDIIIDRRPLGDIFDVILASISHHRFIAVSIHKKPNWNHYHCVHLCRWDVTQRNCRCPGLRYLTKAPGERRYIDATKANFGEHCARMLEYICQAPRQLILQKTATTLWGDIRVDPDRAVGQDSRITNEPVVESDGHQLSHIGGLDDRLPVEPSTSTNSITCTNRAQRKLTTAFLADRIRSLGCIPVQNCVLTKLWKFDSDVRFVTEEDKMFRKAVSYVGSLINYKSTLELDEYHKSTKNIFRNYMGDPNYYYSVTDSINVIRDFLNFQFNEDREHISKFLQDCINILDKKLPKMNCLEIISPPSSGKNFFFDFLAGFYLNVGTIGNFNRFSNFPFQDCVNRRLLIWNEPNVESSAFDTCKMLFGGDPLPAKIKFCGDATIPRTPVIVLSNKTVFPNDQAFIDRMIKYKWKPASILKGYSRYPNPLAWPLLLTEFDVNYG